VEDIRSVLEGSSELGGISSQSVVVSINSNGWVVLDNRVSGIVVVVNESRVGSVSTASSNVVGGDIVSDSHDTVAVIVLDAGHIGCRGKSPVEA